MSKASKALKAAKENPASLSFSELRALVTAAGFSLVRTSGSHHVYTKPGVVEIINLQPNSRMAKVYQVRQVLALIDKYNIEVQ